MAKLDEEMKRTDQLLYQMIPRTVADRLRKGEPALNTCEVRMDASNDYIRNTLNKDIGNETSPSTGIWRNCLNSVLSVTMADSFHTYECVDHSI